MEEKEAQNLAQQFIIMFNGSFLYGCAHPNTVKNVTAFSAALNKSFTGQQIITFALNRKELLVEKWPLDEAVNTDKIAAHFGKIGVKSISFQKGVQVDSLQRLLALAGDINNIGACKANIAAAKPGTLAGIKINSPAAAATSGKKPEKAVKMPQRALNTSNMLFLVSREIKRHIRYNAPFSTITASIKQIKQNGKSRLPKSEELTELLPQLFDIIQPLLRDVDLAGTIISPELFMALPMTGEEGAKIVMERILEKAADFTFTVANQKVSLNVKVSVTVPTELTKDIRSYLKQTMLNHNS
ncbi:MAG: hypothetical protein LBI42_04400 [Chitinispirillales bacterium]|jgi:GGDEF domain-containing protein|nr:hypothetical protein [Chitinispirillales bacterium]